MSEELTSKLSRVAANVEARRVYGVMKSTPGALGEPRQLLSYIERQAPLVSRTEVVEAARAEACRQIAVSGYLDKRALEYRVSKLIQKRTDQRRANSQP